DADTGGGLYNAACGCGTATLQSSTLSGNYATQIGGGIANSAGTVNVINSIVAGNGAGSTDPDVAALGTMTYSRVNVFSQAGAGRPGIDIVATNVGTGVLANNGGPVETIALLPGSVARNAGDNAALPPDSQDLDGDHNTTEPLPVDARGLVRVANGTVDVGAFEVQNTAPVAQDGSASGNEDTAIHGTAPASDVDLDPLTFALVGPNGGAQHGT